MKRYVNKISIITTSVVLLLLVAVGSTLAYIFTETEPIENTFTPSRVSCAVVENGRDPVSGSIVNIGASKDNVRIKNTGDTDAYIRVAVTVNWVSADGKRVWAQKPIPDNDYTITYNLGDGWIEGADGFYYYSKVVSPKDLTSALINNAGLNSGVTAPIGTDSTQYYLSIEIVASAIQATSDAVRDWSGGVATAATDGAVLTVRQS